MQIIRLPTLRGCCAGEPIWPWFGPFRINRLLNPRREPQTEPRPPEPAVEHEPSSEDPQADRRGDVA